MADWGFYETGNITTTHENGQLITYRTILTPVDSQAARFLDSAEEIYNLLQDISKTQKPGQYIPAFLEFQDKARDFLEFINGSYINA